MISTTRSGNRIVELIVPFKWADGEREVAVRRAVIHPMTLGQSLAWSEGGYDTIVDLLAEMLGWTVEQTKALRFPDVDRVMEQFLTMVPENVRSDVASGIVPRQTAGEAFDEGSETGEEGGVEGEAPAETSAVPAGPDPIERFPDPAQFPPSEARIDFDAPPPDFNPDKVAA